MPPQLPTKLEYSFPTAQTTTPVRDGQLQKGLKLEERKPKNAIFTNVPLLDGQARKIHHPLQDILEISRNEISNFVLELPSHSKKNTDKTTKTAQMPISSRTRGTKRNRAVSKEEEDHHNTSHCYANSSSNYNTPIPNKTIFFSPAGSVKRNALQSTPVSVLKETNLNRNGKFLKFDKAKILMGENKENNVQSQHNDSDYDNLACHAENILRMAVDTTMLGSTFNSSFSSINDSIIGKKDITEEDCDRSVIELLKSKRNNLLKKLQATRIEISAEDLKNAVSG
jgi:catabolite regulation protein CreA